MKITVDHLIHVFKQHHLATEAMREVIRECGYAHNDITPLGYIVMHLIAKDPEQCLTDISKALQAYPGGGVKGACKVLVRNGLLENNYGEHGSLNNIRIRRFVFTELGDSVFYDITSRLAAINYSPIDPTCEGIIR